MFVLEKLSKKKKKKKMDGVFLFSSRKKKIILNGKNLIMLHLSAVQLYVNVRQDI